MGFVKNLARKVRRSRQRGLDFSIHSYLKPDGSFDLDAYRQIQEAGNKAKINVVFADEKTLRFIADYLPTPLKGICHGTRRGMEQKWLSEMTGADVIGTEISETATSFPNTVQWDFHDRNEAWVGQFDFVYTNSHDHAHDPAKAITAWVEQLKPEGALVIEHTTRHTPEFADERDPFGVRPEFFPYLVAKWGAGRFAVTEILEPPFTKPNGNQIWVFVIRRLAARRD